jgi:hypothetical protein
MNRTFKIGIFDEEEKFISSIRALQDKNLTIHDVFTPYPIHEVFHLLKVKSRLPLAAYLFGIFAIVAVLAFLYYTSVMDWPIDYGGKPFNSFPSFVVITVVLTIFTVTILSLGVFSARSKLVPGRENTIFDYRATDDKFVIVIETGKQDSASLNLIADIMKEHGASEIHDKEFEKIYA